LGEDKLRQYLDSNVWYYTIVDANSTTNGVPRNNMRRIIAPPGTDGISPLEYLIFNDNNFLEWILYQLPEEQFEEGFIDGLLLDITEMHDDEILPEYIETVWEVVKEMSIKELNSLFIDSIRSAVYIFVYDTDFYPVFPLKMMKLPRNSFMVMPTYKFVY
jgi:hypothetical protein